MLQCLGSKQSGDRRATAPDASRLSAPSLRGFRISGNGRQPGIDVREVERLVAQSIVLIDRYLRRIAP